MCERIEIRREGRIKGVRTAPDAKKSRSASRVSVWVKSGQVLRIANNHAKAMSLWEKAWGCEDGYSHQRLRLYRFWGGGGGIREGTFNLIEM